MPERLPVLGVAAFLVVAALEAQEPTLQELAVKRDGALELRLTDQTLQVTGIAPGGEVAYLGASYHEVHESWGSTRTYSGVMADDDGDGEVEVSPEAGVSEASIWVVVDLTSGISLGAAPDRFKAPVPEEMRLTVSADLRSVAADRQELRFLLHRPGVGIWLGKGVDGGEGDESLHADGRLRVDLRSFRSLGTGPGPAPGQLQAGDRLLAIDLTSLDSTDLAFE